MVGTFLYHKKTVKKKINMFIFWSSPDGKTGRTVVKGIDWATCRRARPTVDVVYLLWTSYETDFR